MQFRNATVLFYTVKQVVFFEIKHKIILQRIQFKTWHLNLLYLIVIQEALFSVFELI